MDGWVDAEYRATKRHGVEEESEGVEDVVRDKKIKPSFYSFGALCEYQMGFRKPKETENRHTGYKQEEKPTVSRSPSFIH
jgi:hypothetical protein